MSRTATGWKNSRGASRNFWGGPMIQSWLNVAGLALDFAGFCLLLREWWLAFFNEGRQLELEEQLERARSMRTFASGHASEHQRRHLETSGRMMDDAAVRRARAAYLAARGARRGIFLAAAALIVVGFLLQIAGALPV